ncbi:MAG: hypothetical protein ACT4PP_11180 [Sporichthyaceae bacterium]
MSASTEVMTAVTAASDRLRTLPESRLRRVEESVRAVLERLAELGAGIEARAVATPPRAPAVPELSVFALGDQLAVLGTDVVVGLDALARGDLVWLAGDRAPAARALEAAAQWLGELRALL